MSKKYTQEPCFALVGRECSALKIKDCEDCRFYKTKGQAREDRQKSLNRIKTLDETLKACIIEKYYDGKLEL